MNGEGRQVCVAPAGRHDEVGMGGDVNEHGNKRKQTCDRWAETLRLPPVTRSSPSLLAP